jgi:stearoyl-CoA desaturase (delta-9 desaturase)
MWQHRWYDPLLLSGLALPFLVGYAYNGWIGGVSCFMLAGVGWIFLVLNSTFCINSVCHLWESQRYSRSNSSRDSWWMSLITLGEGYHNYHHTFPRDYRNGLQWYNVDPSKWLIYVLSKLGLVKGLVRCNSGVSSSKFLVSSFQRLFPDNMKPETRNQQLHSRTTLHSQGPS